MLNEWSGESFCRADEMRIMHLTNVARIPFPMTEDDFDLLIGTLNLWKKKLIAPKSEPDAKSETFTASSGD